MAGSKHPAHVFIDNSNIWGGAQRAAKTREPHVPYRAIRVYFRHLVTLVERAQERPVTTRILGGSVPPGNDDLWGYARDLKYNTDLLRRVEADDGRLIEQAVDEVIHLKIANTVLDHDVAQTLVIVTGDGKLSSFDTSFPAQAERALRRGWNVEVWSWKDQLSGAWSHLNLHKGTLTIRHLDPYYESVTFVEGGTYWGGVVVPRVVSKLPN